MLIQSFRTEHDLILINCRCNYLRDLQNQVNSEEVTRRPLYSVKSALDSEENQRKVKGQVLPDIRKQECLIHNLIPKIGTIGIGLSNISTTAKTYQSSEPSSITSREK